MLKTIDLPLSETLIKEFHFHLKSGVFEDMANGYPVGEYKNRANVVSDITTSTPQMVAEKMKNLLVEYNELDKYDVNSLMKFHADFEHIHPFQDGNGRVGRMILFRECLKHEIIPIIIRDESKAEYYHVLHEAQVNHNYKPVVEYARKQQMLCKEELAPFVQVEEGEIENHRVPERISERRQDMLREMKGINLEQ